MDVEEAAARLYAVPLEQFIPTRTTLVAEARAAGDREAAGEIGALRKPSVAAWLVNQLARLDPQPLAALTSLGSRLRDAQASLDADQLRTLGRERTGVLDEAMARAAALAAQRDLSLSAGVSSELRATFVAGLATAEAGAAVRSGRLVRALSYAGFGEVDLDEATAGSLPSLDEASVPKSPPRRQAKGAEEPGPVVAEGSGPSAADVRAEQRRRAQRGRAEALVASRRKDLEDLAARQQTAEARVAELEERLEAAQAALVEVVGRKGKAQRALREAQAALAALD